MVMNKTPEAEKPETERAYRLISVESLERWRDAFAEELSAWDIDPPLHHVKTSHDEIVELLATPKSVDTDEAAKQIDIISNAMIDANLPPGWCLANIQELQCFAAALLAADSKAGGEVVAIVEVSVPHLRSIVVKAIPGAQIPGAGTLLYASPQKQANPLTVEEISEISAAAYCGQDRDSNDIEDSYPVMFARGIESAHGIG